MIERAAAARWMDVFIWGMIILGMAMITGCGVDRMMRGSVPAEPPPTITAEAFRVFDRNGHPAELADILRRADDAEAIFIGESHGDPAAHHLEKEILAALHDRYGSESPSRSSTRPIILSMEMFERDVQIILDEYLQDLITERHFRAGSRPWPRYERDYRPLVEFAKNNGLPVIAANAPRRYVNRVSRLGTESLAALSETAKSWLPPLPYPPASPEYRQKFMGFWQMSIGSEPDPEPAIQAEAAEKIPDPMKEGKPHSATGADPSRLENLLNAQSLWDAALGHAAAEALIDHPGALVITINGRFHSEENLGAPEKLRFYRPGTEILTVTIIPAKSFPDFDERYLNYGDFVIITDPGPIDSTGGS